MTVPIVFFGLVLLMALGLAWGLLRGLRPPQDDPSCSDLKPDPSRYELLTKLMGRTEPYSLADWKPGHSMKRARRKLTRRCLREMRGDFLQVCSVCRLIAPVVSDQEFMVKVVRELVRFHVFYVRAHVSVLVGTPLGGAVEPERFAQALGHLQQAAYAVLPAK